MSRKAILIGVGVLALAGGAAAVAAVGEREHGMRMAQLAERGGGMGPGGMMGRPGMGGDEGPGMGRPGMRGGRNDDRGGRWGRGPSMTKDEFDARVRERFARIDKNGDGVIDRAEIETQMATPGQGMRRGMGGQSRGDQGGRGDQAGAAPGPAPGNQMLQRGLRRFDTNNDGKVTRDEMVAAVRRQFARFDIDGDGRITDADLPPMMRGMNVLKGGDNARGGGFGMAPGGMMLGRLRAADANGDGIITIDEAVAAATRRFDQFDRNKDGTIDQADFDQIRKETTDYRVQRFLARYGATKDGRITREQFATLAAEQFRLLDSNGDGRVDRDDRGGMRSPRSGR